jgi:transposase
LRHHRSLSKCSEGTFNYSCNIILSGHVQREIAVTLSRNTGHDPAKSPVTMARNTHVKELQDRLNQNPDNSSRPPTSQAPWAKKGGSEEQSGAADESGTAEAAAETATGSSTEETEQALPVDGQRSSTQTGSGKRPGKQPGSPGHGRSQKLAITTRREHRPESCAACGAALSADAASQAYTAWDEVDIAPPVEGLIGLTFRVTRHTLLEVSCSCGHVSRAQPWRAPADGQWQKVELGEWRLVGPRLAGIIVFLALRMRLSRARIRELLMELFDLTLSTGVIDETIREAGRASLPLEDALVADIVQAAQLHVDETSWPESGVLLWLWALVTTHTVLFLIGPRSREMLENALQDGYLGILISDGYAVYRAWEESPALLAAPPAQTARPGRIERCAGLRGWARDGRIMKTLMAAIYAARIDPPPEGLPVRYAPTLRDYRNCAKRIKWMTTSHCAVSCANSFTTGR